MNKLYKSEVWLKHQVWRLQRKPEDIAKECGVSLMTIYNYMNKFHLGAKR